MQLILSAMKIVKLLKPYLKAESNEDYGIAEEFTLKNRLR